MADIVTASDPGIVRRATDPNWTQIELLQVLDQKGLLQAGSRIISRISAAQAMKQSVVSAALDVIAQDIGKVRLRLVRETPESIYVVKPDEHGYARRLALDPNPHQTWAAFWRQAIATYVLRQEVVFYRRRTSRRDVTPALVPLMHHEWTQNADGFRFYYQVSPVTSGRVTMIGTSGGNVSADDVIHVVGRSESGYEALSTVSIGSDVLGLNAMVVDFQAALVKGGTRPTVAIEVPGQMTDEAFERLRTQITKALADAAARGEPFILEQGSKVNAFGLDADQTDLVNARQQLARDVARLFRMPPHKIGMTEDLNKSNLEAMEKSYVDDTLVPICEDVEQQLSRSLLDEDERLAGHRFLFDREQLYDRDPQARRERIEMQFKAGLIYANEARAKLSLPPLPDDQDHRSLPVNTALLFRDGRVQIFTSQSEPRPDANDTAPADPSASGQTVARAVH